MRKLEEFAEHIHVGLRASGEIYSPHPRMYYWRCWLADEFASVSFTPDGTRPARGLGVDMLESMRDLVTVIRGRTIWVRRVDNPEPERFEVDADLIV